MDTVKLLCLTLCVTCVTACRSIGRRVGQPLTLHCPSTWSAWERNKQSIERSRWAYVWRRADDTWDSPHSRSAMYDRNRRRRRGHRTSGAFRRQDRQHGRVHEFTGSKSAGEWYRLVRRPQPLSHRLHRVCSIVLQLTAETRTTRKIVKKAYLYNTQLGNITAILLCSNGAVRVALNLVWVERVGICVT